MQVLVMGGTQFNGLALVHDLVRNGHVVTVLNRGKTEAVLPRGVLRLTADRNDPASMRATLGGKEFDCIFDVSAYRTEDVELMIDIFRGRVGHYIFISSTVIYAANDILPIDEDALLDDTAGQNDYGRNKIACERLLLREYRERNFPMSIVALSMVFGPHNLLPDREQRMFARILQGRPVLIPGDGMTLAQVGHVDDQARALRMMMQKNSTLGRRYNLTGADFFTGNGYVDECVKAIGKEADRLYIPAPLMDDMFDGKVALRPNRSAPADVSGWSQAQCRASNQWMLSTLVQHVAPHIHRWNRNVIFGIERLKQDIGWAPQYSFPAAVQQTYDWYRSDPVANARAFDFTFEDEVIAKVRAYTG
jgi:nucleoside-diphosphate-sugar epimerase